MKLKKKGKKMKKIKRRKKLKRWRRASFNGKKNGFFYSKTAEKIIHYSVKETMKLI